MWKTSHLYNKIQTYVLSHHIQEWSMTKLEKNYILFIRYDHFHIFFVILLIHCEKYDRNVFQLLFPTFLS